VSSAASTQLAENLNMPKSDEAIQRTGALARCPRSCSVASTCTPHDHRAATRSECPAAAAAARRAAALGKQHRAHRRRVFAVISGGQHQLLHAQHTAPSTLLPAPCCCEKPLSACASFGVDLLCAAYSSSRRCRSCSALTTRVRRLSTSSCVMSFSSCTFCHTLARAAA
jgi:hypothetical protein